MRAIMKMHIKKMVSLMLVVAMVLTTNVVAFAETISEVSDSQETTEKEGLGSTEATKTEDLGSTEATETEDSGSTEATEKDATNSKTTPQSGDFIFTAPTTLTAGTARSAAVAVKEGISGMGEITVCYSSDGGSSWVSDVPQNAGTYNVAIDVAEGETYSTGTKITSDTWTFTLGEAETKSSVDAGSVTTPKATDSTVKAPGTLAGGESKSTGTKIKLNETGIILGDGMMSTEEAEAADASGTVKFTNEPLVKYLAYFGYALNANDPDSQETDDNLECFSDANNKRDGSLNPTSEYGIVSKEDLAKIKKITIRQKLGPETFAQADWNAIRFTQLNEFTSLEELIIEGDNKLDFDGITLPASLKKISVNNESKNFSLDVSNCSNLEEIEFKNCTLASGVITGLATPKTLKKLVFENTNISSITLRDANDITSAGVSISAINCDSLTTCNTGKYKVSGSQSFKDCDELTTLTIINGIASGTSQEINLNGCAKLENITLSYKFSAATDRLNVLASGIVKPNATTTDFSLVTGSAEGKYSLKAVKDSFLDKYANDYPSVFDGGAVLSNSPSFVVFSQDRADFEKEKHWITASKIRDYDARPIVLKVGQQIEDNTPYFYSDDGTLFKNLTTANYDVSLTNVKIPTSAELSGFAGTYNVISYSSSRALTVTALNPGVVDLTVSTKGGTSVSKKQRIIVLDEVVSATINQDAKFYGGGETHLFTATYTMKYPSLSAYSEITTQWKLYRKNSSGTYDDIGYAGATADGLEIHNSQETTTVNPDGTISNKYSILVTKNAIGGDYRVGGTICKNDGTNDSLTASVASSGNNEIAIGNLTANSEYMGYNNIEVYSGVDPNLFPSTVQFHLTDVDTNAFNVTPPSVSGTEANKVLKVTPAGGGNYNLEFKPEASAKDVGKFLRSLGNDSRITVTASIGEKGKAAKTFSRKVTLAGRFSLSFDNNGGTIATQNASAYQIPHYVYLIYYLEDFAFDSPTREGYDFKGWHSDEYNETFTSRGELYGDLSLKALWEPTKYAISYDLQGGTNNSANPSEYTLDTASFSLAAPTKAGYSFAGWTGSNITGVSNNVTVAKGSKGELSFTATWKPIKYSISYDLQGGTISSRNPSEYTIETETFSLANPTKSGYTFKGWSGTNLSDTAKTVTITKGTTGNLSYKAVWASVKADDNNNEESSEEKNEGSSSSSEGSGGSSNSAPATNPVVVNSFVKKEILPTYIAPEMKTVMSTVVNKVTGETKTVEINVNNSITETLGVSATKVAAINASQTANVGAPTIITAVSVVVDKKDASPTAKAENIRTEIDATTVNGVVSISPSLVDSLKNVAAEVCGTNPAQTDIQIRVNTWTADGRPLRVVVSSENLKTNAVLKAYAMDPITGQYIMINVPNVIFDKNTGLTTSGLVSGLEYHYVPVKVTKAIENSIYNSIKLSDTFEKPVQAVPGGVIDMSQAISPVFCRANASNIQYSVSGSQAVIDPTTGLLILNGNAKKGTITVTIKITLTNGRTKTIKSKIKIS